MKLAAQLYNLLFRRQLCTRLLSNINKPHVPIISNKQHQLKIFLSRPTLCDLKCGSKYLHQSFAQSFQQSHYLSKEFTNDLEYEHISNETLESLTEKLEYVLEDENAPKESDITYSSGVLTLKLGKHGTYVINKQSPNKQIWLSSPLSGPKRYDFVDNNWIYKHDNISLFDLLNQELSFLLNKDIDVRDNIGYSGVKL